MAHIGGLPVEETVGSIGPAILVAFGAAFRATWWRARKERSDAHPSDRCDHPA
jgi:hypothetical protein